MLRTRLSIQQRQRMAMSPGLRTGLSVLRMSTLDLIDAIEAEAADNPYLLHEDLRPRAASGAGSAYDVMLDTMAEVPSLIAKLHKQIGAMTLSPAVRAVAEYLAGDLREDGFLDTPLGDLAMSLDLPAVLIEQGLAALQSCDPVGVGARNLAECLTLQLIDRGLSADLAGNMIDHLHLFAVEDWRALQRALGLERSELLHLAGLIRNLNPHPITPDIAPDTFLLPDLILDRDGSGAHVVRLGVALGDQVRLNADLITATRAAGGDFAADRRTRAEAMIQALRFRGQTLLRIGQAIADHQHRFFALGPDHLAPMSRRDLAAKLGLHASTIGRAVSSKAIEVSGRLYPLSLFFSTHLPVEGGLGVAAFVVQRRIAQLIEQEPVHAPLSDDAICAALRATGVDIARRTVAKYRGCMRIPSSFARRRRKAPQHLRPGKPGSTHNPRA